jgi:hypothetical protein
MPNELNQNLAVQLCLVIKHGRPKKELFLFANDNLSICSTTNESITKSKTYVSL